MAVFLVSSAVLLEWRGLCLHILQFVSNAPYIQFSSVYNERGNPFVNSEKLGLTF